MNKKVINLIFLGLIIFSLFSCNSDSVDSNTPIIPEEEITDVTPIPPSPSTPEVIIPEYNVDDYEVYSGVDNIKNQTLQAQKILEGDNQSQRYKKRKNRISESDGIIVNDYFVFTKDEYVFDEIRNSQIAYIFGDIFALLEVNVLTGNAVNDITGKCYFLNNDKSSISEKYVYFDFLNEDTFVVCWYVYDLLNQRSESVFMHIVSIDEENPFVFSLDTNSKGFDSWFVFSHMDKHGTISSVSKDGRWTDEIDELINYIAYYNEDALLPFVYLKKEFKEKNINLDFFTELDVDYMMLNYLENCNNLYLFPKNLSREFVNTMSEPNLELAIVEDESVVSVDITALAKTVVVPDGVKSINLDSLQSDPENEVYASFYGWYIPQSVTEITSESFKNIAVSMIFTEHESFSDEMLDSILKYNPTCKIYYAGQWRISCGVYVPNEAYLELETPDDERLNLLNKLSTLDQFEPVLSHYDFQKLFNKKNNLKLQTIDTSLSVEELNEKVNLLFEEAISQIKLSPNMYEISYSLNYDDLSIKLIDSHLIMSEGLILKKVDNYYEVVGTNGAIDVVIPAYYEGLPVKTIGEKAFYRNVKMKSIVIPNTITEIKDDAFNLSFNLIDINYLGTIDDWFNVDFGNEYSNPMCVASKFYSNNELITEVYINENITEITNELSGFNITKIVIPANVKLGDGAFSTCIYLEEVILPNDLESIPNNLFYGCISLKNVQIPETVTSIGSNAFYGCVLIEEFNLPETVTSIGRSAFASCFKLKEIVLSDNITEIGYSAFANCTSLTYVKLPSNITKIDNNLFAFCTSLESITIPNTVTSLGEGAFVCCYNLKEVNIPKKVQIIENSTFIGCFSLEEIILPEGITEIGSDAFSGCISLKKIKLPESLTKIGMYAFENCPEISYLVLPSEVKFVEGYIFAASSIKDIYLNTSKVMTNDWDISWSYTLLTEYNEETKKWYPILNNVYYQGEWEYIDGIPTVINQ